MLAGMSDVFNCIDFDICVNDVEVVGDPALAHGTFNSVVETVAGRDQIDFDSKYLRHFNGKVTARGRAGGRFSARTCR